MRPPYEPPQSRKKVVRGVSRSDLIDRARSLVPKLRERASATEERRNLLEATIREFHDLGLWRILQPERWGGFEMDYAIIVDVVSEVGRGCTSSAWILGNFTSRLWQIGMLPEEAQQAVWGKDTSTLVCSTYVFPCGRVTKVADGWRVQGVRPWPFASGVDISEWATVGALCYDEKNLDAKPEPIQVLLHKSEYTVSDTWYASGLIGTGSKDLVVGDVTIPWYRGSLVREFRGGPTPGSKTNPGPLYKLPVFAAFPHIPAAAGLGAAQAAVDDAIAATKKRVSSYTGQSMAELTPVQIKLAEADAAVDAARLLLLDNCDEMMAIAEADRPFDLATRARYRRDGAYAAKLFTQAVDLCVQVTGAAGLYNRNPMQRYFRDVHAVLQHISVVWDVSAQVYGGVALGLEPLLPTV
jgi:3-hydroxy-9,10-secoandrosta-1,3,5(10)-triene-9,17-dione monooxygenase